MKAVVVDKNTKGWLVVRDAADPQPLPSQAVIAVRALSLNRGEIRRAQAAEDGSRIGWDIAGIIDEPAADGSGPAKGTRVVGFLPAGAWAERTAVPTDSIAPLPESVSFEVASTLPVAGLTALMTLDKRGSLAGRRVLVTGASGGVGHFALQIARASGAHAVGMVHREERRAAVEPYADVVVAGEDATVAKAHGPFDIILESVGGNVFSTAIGLLNTDGMLVTFGTSAQKQTTIDVSTFYATGGAAIYGFILFHEVKAAPAGRGLLRLLDLIERGDLTPRIDKIYTIDQIAEASQFFWDRNITGKVVVTL